VNRVVAAEAVESEVAALVEDIARASALTVGIGKEAFYAQVELDEHRAYDLTKAVMAMNARADDAQEGMSAFLEKRAPEWRGT
jgi:enoyl-CoA hydratase/carnithine racemase